MSDTDFAAIIEPVARHLLGGPNKGMSSRTELRFGGKGSIAVQIGGDGKGTWYDFEGGQGGGVLDLAMVQKRLTKEDAVQWLRRQSFHTEARPANLPKVERPKQENKSVHASPESCAPRMCVDGYQFSFRLGSVELQPDADGGPVTTLIVEEAESVATSKPLPSLSDIQQMALRCLRDAINAEAVLVTVREPPRNRSAVTAEPWRQWFYLKGKPGENAVTKRSAFSRASDALLEKGRIEAENDYVWITSSRA